VTRAKALSDFCYESFAAFASSATRRSIFLRALRALRGKAFLFLGVLGALGGEALRSIGVYRRSSAAKLNWLLSAISASLRFKFHSRFSGGLNGDRRPGFMINL
jgi:hypothetical protein